jgi:hypothetical protein
VKLTRVFACFALACAHAVAAPEVRVVEVPGGGGVPDAETGADGTIHLVWVKADDVWYAKSTDNGRSFSAPLRVNSDPGTAHPPNMFRGPDVAVGRDGMVHVIWYNNAFQRKRPKDEWGVNYARLEAKAGAFTPTRNLNHLPSDGFSLGTNERGQVAVVYMTGKLNLLTSQDNGETFAPPREIEGVDPCECCASRALLDGNGTLFTFYRDKAENVRDMFVLRVRERSVLGGLVDQQLSTRTRLSTRPWSIAGCPMTGESLTRAGNGFVAAWETKGEVSFTRLDASGKPSGTPEFEVAPRGKFPIALANTDDIVCVSWKEGSQLNWRLFDRDNRPIGEPDSAPAPSGDRHAGAVTRVGDFLLFP